MKPLAARSAGMRTLLAVLIAAPTLAACGEDRTPETDTSRVPGPTDTIVIYQRTGGEEGARERLDVRPDGAAGITDHDKSARTMLTPGELDSLQHARMDVDFEHLAGSYGPKPPLADASETTLMSNG